MCVDVFMYKGSLMLLSRLAMSVWLRSSLQLLKIPLESLLAVRRKVKFNIRCSANFPSFDSKFSERSREKERERRVEEASLFCRFHAVLSKREGKDST